jgi:hypothetical protein
VLNRSWNDRFVSVFQYFKRDYVTKRIHAVPRGCVYTEGLSKRKIKELPTIVSEHYPSSCFYL